MVITNNFIISVVIVFINAHATIMDKIYGTNSSFHVKAQCRKALISIFQRFSAGVGGGGVGRGGWALDDNSMRF